MGLDVACLFDRSVPDKEASQRGLASLRKGASWYEVCLNHAIHTLVVSPVGGGKSTGMAIPFLRKCRQSAVILDFKAELWALTSAVRAAMGHRIVCLDPYGMVTDKPDTYNPPLDIDPASPLALDDCKQLANAFVVRTGQEKDPHFNDEAEHWIATMIAVTVALASNENRSTQSVRLLLTDPARMQDAIKFACESQEWGGMLARMGHQMTHALGEERGSILTTANRHMNFLDTPAIYKSTISSSFDPKQLLEGNMTIYLILPPDRIRSQMGLLRMWISSLLRVVVRGGLNPKNNIHFILDEAASLGHLDALDDAVDKYRGYGLRLALFYQSMGQFKKCWPDGGDQTLLSNTSQVFFAARDKLSDCPIRGVKRLRDNGTRHPHVWVRAD